MAELQVRVYDVTTKKDERIFLGNLYFNVDNEKADIIIRNYRASLMGVLNPVCEEFFDDVLDEALNKKFTEYFEEHPCDLDIEIAKRI
jgi:hypothetical protein